MAVSGSEPRQRGSLFFRLFGAGALIALVAIAAATFATVHSTSVAVQQAQQQSLHEDARTYDALIGYAATHRSWVDARPLVDRLAAASGDRVSVTDPTGRTLVDSTGSRRPHVPSQARAVLDPLSVDTTLLPESTLRQDPVKEQLRAIPCDSAAPSCRWYEVTAPAVDSRVVGPFRGASATAALSRLRARIDGCLDAAGLRPTTELRTEFIVTVDYPERHGAVRRCVDESRRAMLSNHVAPRALLFVGDSRARADVLWDLSRGGWLRIVLLAGAVLAVTLALCVLLARRIVGPLREMAAIALRAGEGDLTARVAYGRQDEVGEVARAFNTMADRREQLEVARRRLVSDVSHELRTPVSNARAWLEGAQDGLVDAGEELLASLHEEMLHLQHLIEDLHQLSLGDAGELRIRAEQLDLESFLDQIGASFRGAAETAGVDLIVQTPVGGQVHADPLRLRQALSNLVANALRHTPPGGRITVSGVPGRVAVSDTGEGIPADELPQVFERFHRVDPSRSRSSGGSGLGLAIVRQIAEAHGGTATIESIPGGGTSVTLILP